MEDEEFHSLGHTYDPKTLLQNFLNQRTNSYPIINRFSLFMREPTPTPTTAIQSDDHQNDWAYSKPVIVVDVVWNLGFVLVSLFLLLSTLKERPSTPLRVWITGYALQCLLHVVFVYLEHRRRNSDRLDGDEDEEEHLLYRNPQRPQGSIAKRLESMNTMISLVWWVVGFYWIVVGGQTLLQDAPMLYWLAVVFLAFDVFFAIFCVILACMIGIAVFCCLPCIIVMLCSLVVREGATEDDIRVLPRYKFVQNWKQEVPLMESGGDSISEIFLPPEDSECCICLSKYVDGVELHRLPCNHYFHCRCIVKWLRINAKCPLCKYNILDDELV